MNNRIAISTPAAGLVAAASFASALAFDASAQLPIPPAGVQTFITDPCPNM